MHISTENDKKALSESYISQLIDELHEECRLERSLPGGGYLHMSDELPYLVVYRAKETENEDKATARFVMSEASFLIIGNENFEGFQRLIYCLSEAMSSKFESFLVFEIFAGEFGNDQFKIKGPAEKLPATLETLKKELDNLSSKYKVLPLKPAAIEDTIHRHPDAEPPLLEMDVMKEVGCLILGLEIPPVYRNNNGEEYPVFFRNFKDDLVLALHKTIFEFLRIQTTSGVKKYYALGQSSIKEEVLHIDRQLVEIETSYKFLWLVSPANIRQIKDTFFESNFETVLNYHYRLLPIDPDILKRQLYNLKIEKVDDPALSFLLREKREELEMQISMLNDRGTKEFYYNSLMLYHGVDNDLKKEALELLEQVEEQEISLGEDLADAEEFKKLAEEEFEYFRQQDENFSSKIHIRDDVNILMVSQGELFIPSDYRMNATESRALIQHEVGTHILTYYNGLQQPLGQFSTGLTDYDTLQEGLAVLSEYLVGGLTSNRMRTLAGRVIAADALIEGSDFKEIFNLLHRQHGFSAARAFNITSRILQGSGFIKDIIYLKGIVELKKHLEEG
ncbi:MAG TPA: tyrosine/phenylalanine carboxypeptidase domain-containing protein, partial [Salinimicrobium sp.]|nr:tyrosine/phenylalanine carboxypeptidase domain-containing protein [Salinimicrobium sp.]